MSAVSEQVTNALAHERIGAHFAVSSCRAVQVVCTDCGHTITVPESLCPEHAQRWAVQHRIHWHKPGSARPKPLLAKGATNATP